MQRIMTACRDPKNSGKFRANFAQASVKYPCFLTGSAVRWVSCTEVPGVVAFHEDAAAPASSELLITAVSEVSVACRLAGTCLMVTHVLQLPLTIQDAKILS